MPASRRLRMRASPGGDPSIISDLYIDDAGVVTLAAPTVKSPGAQRTQAATTALRAAGARRRRGASYKPVAAARAAPKPVAAAAHAPVDEAPPRRAVAAPRAAAVARQGKPAAEAPGARGPVRLRLRPHAAAARCRSEPAAAAALPAVRARDAARESGRAAAAVVCAVPLLALGQRGLAVAGGVSPVPSSSTKTCKCVPAPLRASPLRARRVAVVTESQLREREASPWTVLLRIVKRPPAARLARPKTH